MSEEEIKKLVEDTVADILAEMIGIDRFMFKKNIQIFDARNIQTGRENGTIIATETDQKLGFYGTTPVDQPATVTDPSGGAVIDSEARTAVKNLIDRLQELGLIG